MDSNLLDNTRKKKSDTFTSNSKRFLPFMLLIALVVSIAFSIVISSKYKQLNKEILSSKLSRESASEENIFEWVSSEKLEELYLSPTLSITLEDKTPRHFSCLDYQEYISLDKVVNSLRNNQLKSGLENIEEHIFTFPLIDEQGDSLPSIKSKYEISFTNICKLSENKFVVLFLTTQAIREKTSLVLHAQAAGGWIGDSHMAIIDGDTLKIYERFPFNASLINLPKEGKDSVILRFGAYYNCGKVVAITEDNIIIKCSGNIYSFNFQKETFQELAICGNYIDNGSYMTNKYSCFDASGNNYLNHQTP